MGYIIVFVGGVVVGANWKKVWAVFNDKIWSKITKRFNKED